MHRPSKEDQCTLEAMNLIKRERQRQIEDEGWSIAHDDEHTDGQLLKAATIYLHCDPADPAATPMNGDLPLGWPWDRKWWKPKDRRANLVRAGALALAEYDRLERSGRSGLHAWEKHTLAVHELTALLLAGAA